MIYIEYSIVIIEELINPKGMKCNVITDRGYRPSGVTSMVLGSRRRRTNPMPTN